ncbi:MAG: CapA family protein [Bacteroidetes bacterium]|nr:CapA family protein [Bacteroidota bacterium]
MNWYFTAFGFLCLFFFDPSQESIDVFDRKLKMARNYSTDKTVRIFLCGDVMTGRGIDQILPHPSNPQIYESYMKDAIGYVAIAERANGPVPAPVSYDYIWGDASKVLDNYAPDLRIINLETSITTSDDYWKGKGINYRMHPQNIACLSALKIDICVLANNHLLDWGYQGLEETLSTLNNAHLKTSGAGSNLFNAQKPAIMEVKNKGRVLVFSYGTPTSGIPLEWAATDERAGVNMLQKLNESSIEKVKKQIEQYRQPSDVIITSIHWGGNWGYDIPLEQSSFAHELIDKAGVDIIHGHSSHHSKGIEVYKQKLIIYGAGDFINDYEGISGHEQYRDDLAVMYLVKINPVDGRLVELELFPFEIRNFQLHKVSNIDLKWLRDQLDNQGRKLGTRVKLHPPNSLLLQWDL